MSAGAGRSGELDDHAIGAALAQLRAAPMSRKTAMLAALLIDAGTGRLFRRGTAGDVLVFREALARAAPELGLVMALADMREDGPRLVLEAVAVDAADYPGLSEADYMVSLYNGATVPRVLVALPDGTRLQAADLLAAAAAQLADRLAR